MIEISENRTNGARIKVVGVGGAGCNAVNTMIKMGLQGVEFIVANTDRQALDANLAPIKIQIGQELTKGLGAGANPDVGKKAAMEDYALLSEHLNDADMVFVTAGMGGGTGTGASPIISKIARECGALTVGVVTKPFQFEGKKRSRHAEQGVNDLRDQVDSLITIPNQRLLALAGQNLSMLETFRRADEVLLNAVQGISDLINNTGLINCDFADVRTIMQNKGLALMGTGVGRGDDRAVEAAKNAITSPLLDDIRIDGATGIIINITGTSDLALHEVNAATTLIMEAAHEDAEIIFGTVIDENMKDMVKVTVIATGLLGNKAFEQPVATVPGLNPALQKTTMVSQQAINRAVEAALTQTPMSTHTPYAAQPAREQHVAHQAQQAPTPAPHSNYSIQPTPVQPTAVAVEEVQQPLFHSTYGDDNAVTRSRPTDLQRAKSIAKQLGISGIDDSELDIPTFIRKSREDSQDINL